MIDLRKSFFMKSKEIIRISIFFLNSKRVYIFGIEKCKGTFGFKIV